MKSKAKEELMKIPALTAIVAPLALVCHAYAAQPAKFLIAWNEVTDPETIANAVSDLWAGDPGHICFVGTAREAARLLETAFAGSPHFRGVSSSGGTASVTLREPFGGTGEGTFEFLHCAAVSIGGRVTRDFEQIEGAIMDLFAGDPGELCYLESVEEGATLVEYAFAGSRLYKGVTIDGRTLRLKVQDPFEASQVSDIELEPCR